MRKRMFLAWCLTGLFCSMNGTHAVADDKPGIRIYYQDDTEKSGPQKPSDTGLDRVIQYFERATGYHLELVPLPWNRARMMAEKGEGFIFGFSRTPERELIFDYSLPYMVESVWAITYGDPPDEYRSVGDLKGKVVCMGRGNSFGPGFEKVRNQLFRVQEDFGWEAARLRKLINGQCDVVLWSGHVQRGSAEVEQYVNNTLVHNLRDPELLGKTFHVSPNPLFSDPQHFATAKGHLNAELDALNEAIRRGSKSGELPRVLSNYH